jgi:hypothetical protein
MYVRVRLPTEVLIPDHSALRALELGLTFTIG